MLVDKFGDGISGDWRVPGEFGKRVDIDRQNTTLTLRRKSLMTDLHIADHGSIILITPVNEAARQWLDEMSRPSPGNGSTARCAPSTASPATSSTKSLTPASRFSRDRSLTSADRVSAEVRRRSTSAATTKETRHGSIPPPCLHRSRRRPQPAHAGRRPQGRRTGVLHPQHAPCDGRARLRPRRQYAADCSQSPIIGKWARNARPRRRRLRRRHRHPGWKAPQAVEALQRDDAGRRAQAEEELANRPPLHGHQPGGSRFPRSRLQRPLLRAGADLPGYGARLQDLRANHRQVDPHQVGAASSRWPASSAAAASPST